MSQLTRGAPCPGVLADSSGFTLIELLVAMVSGLIVSLAAFALLELGTNLAGQVDDRIDSATSGGVAMTAIVQDLQSSCITPATSPIQSSVPLPSGANSLVFWSSVGGQATVTPVLHAIAFTAGTLTDTRYALVSGTTPSTWTFSSTGTATRLAANISEVSGTPVFQYFAYNSSTGEVSTTNLAPSANLTAAQATTVLAVTVTFSAAPYSTSTLSTRATRQTVLTRRVGLRLSPLGSTGANVACS